MATLKDSADCCRKLFAAGGAFIQFLVGELVGFGCATMRADTVFIVFTPQLGFQKRKAYFVVWKLLLYGEYVHI